MSAARSGGEDGDEFENRDRNVVATYQEEDGIVFYSEDEPTQWILISNPIDVEGWA